MIMIKLVGGAKKSFFTDTLKIDKSDITIQELLVLLLELKPIDTPNLDVENILIAINGVDSSALDGKMTKIKNDDVISIIPVIHGGSPKRLIFNVSNKLVQIIEMDILMRFTISSQISSAINSAGIKSQQNFILIAFGNKKILDALYKKLSFMSVKMFSKDNTSFIKKYFQITDKQLDVALSKNPLEDILIEKAAILL